MSFPLVGNPFLLLKKDAGQASMTTFFVAISGLMTIAEDAAQSVS